MVTYSLQGWSLVYEVPWFSSHLLNTVSCQQILVETAEMPAIYGHGQTCMAIPFKHKGPQRLIHCCPFETSVPCYVMADGLFVTCRVDSHVSLRPVMKVSYTETSFSTGLLCDHVILSDCIVPRQQTMWQCFISMPWTDGMCVPMSVSVCVTADWYVCWTVTVSDLLTH